VLTPNGDGINDEITILVDVINILAPRSLRLRLYDLAGRQVIEKKRDVQASPQQLSWDGRDAGGQRVPPGLYLLELHIDGDAGEQQLRRVVSVVY
jgi:flagellar hook assembly protein FlgD